MRGGNKVEKNVPITDNYGCGSNVGCPYSTAGPHGKIDECEMNSHYKHMFHDLDLTTEQKDKLKQNRKAQHEKMKELKKQVMKNIQN